MKEIFNKYGIKIEYEAYNPIRKTEIFEETFEKNKRNIDIGKIIYIELVSK
ncbi:MAG TPA: hypothetical protein PK894_05240 [Defluviitoga sp.]|nr:hypothetical protein [Defluviitoga sp.]